MPVAQGPWDMNRRASVRATETGRMRVPPVGAATSLWSVYLQYLAWMVAATAAEGEEGREKVKKGMGEVKEEMNMRRKANSEHSYGLGTLFHVLPIRRSEPTRAMRDS